MKSHLQCYSTVQYSTNQCIIWSLFRFISLQEMKCVHYEVRNWQLHDAMLPLSQQRHNLILHQDTKQKRYALTHFCYCCEPYYIQDISFENNMQEYNNDNPGRMMNIPASNFSSAKIKTGYANWGLLWFLLNVLRKYRHDKWKEATDVSFKSFQFHCSLINISLYWWYR